MTYTAMGYMKPGGPDVLTRMDLELANPTDTQVVIEPEAASVNFADIKARTGTYTIPGPPYVPGLDFVGKVVAAGSPIGSHLVGKRVIGFGDTGSYATMLLADVELVFEIPEDMPLPIAAACPLLIGTTYSLLHRNGGLHPGQDILIHSAGGGIGLTAVQMAKVMGAQSIIGLVSSSTKASYVLENGATNVIVTSDHPDYWKPVEKISPDGLDHILNAVGGETIKHDLELLRPHGQLIVFGSASGEPGTIDSSILHHTSKTVSGFSFGHLRQTNPKAARAVMEKALPFVTSGDIKFPVINRYDLLDAASAHRAIESRKTVGKIILTP